jgi:hypothetical protein
VNLDPYDALVGVQRHRLDRVWLPVVHNSKLATKEGLPWPQSEGEESVPLQDLVVVASDAERPAAAGNRGAEPETALKVPPNLASHRRRTASGTRRRAN